ncbi:hypothetical protein LDENG_00036670 [Lucifuga dentata]|nr:hypothetical protein LDENG_00036670 [Lucifuga dentata]
MAVHRPFPFNLTELERVCQEEWDKLPKSRCAELVETYSRSLAAVIASSGAFKC